MRPGINCGAWTEEEDAALVAAHRELGNRWSQIADALPGRTESNVKNRWYATTRLSKTSRKCGGGLLRAYILEVTQQEEEERSGGGCIGGSAGGAVKRGRDCDDDDDAYRRRNPKRRAALSAEERAREAKAKAADDAETAEVDTYAVAPAAEAEADAETKVAKPRHKEMRKPLAATSRWIATHARAVKAVARLRAAAAAATTSSAADPVQMFCSAPACCDEEADAMIWLLSPAAAAANEAWLGSAATAMPMQQAGSRADLGAVMRDYVCASPLAAAGSFLAGSQTTLAGAADGFDWSAVMGQAMEHIYRSVL